jgi:hypothetical protein
MKTVYDNGKLDESYMTEDFVTIRQRVSDEWKKCEKMCLKSGVWDDPRHTSLIAKRNSTASAMDAEIAKYPSDVTLFSDATYNKINSEITKRQAVLEAAKRAKGGGAAAVAVDPVTASKDSIVAAQAALNSSKALGERLAEMNQHFTTGTPAAPGPKTASEYSESDLEYPLMRLNALLDNLSSKL